MLGVLSCLEFSRVLRTDVLVVFYVLAWSMDVVCLRAWRAS